jgi:uncharacterized Zn finger protein
MTFPQVCPDNGNPAPFGCSMVAMTEPAGFTRADLELAAGARSYDRGLGYLHAVADLEVTATEITATVYGSSQYRVRLAGGGGSLSGTCTCPYGQDGFFCKHCVAVGLSVLEIGDDLPRQVEASRARRERLESWLATFSREELLAELLGLLDEDRDLRQRFELRAMSANADALAVRRAVMELIALPHGGYVEESEAYRYANDLDNAATAIEELVKAGEAADAVLIAHEAIIRLSDSLEFVDDRSGAVEDSGRVLLAVHLLACQAAVPEPVPLGHDLADLLLRDGYGLWPDLDDYANLLGGGGLAAVRERVAAAYAENPSSWRAKNLMESIARAKGDVDAVVAIYAAALDDRGHGHLRIARELDGAGRGDEALGWAERGVREAAHPDHQLVEYLAGRYAAAGRADEVLGLRHDRFLADRSLANYQALRQAATDSGRWPAEREEALALLRRDARGLTPRRPWAWQEAVLVDALLDDGDLDAAWAAAKDLATEQQWLRLAGASITRRPADALAVYLRAIEPMKAMTGDKTYRRMASLLLSVRACHEALGTGAEFRRYVTVLRMEQKRKRNLMKILDQSGL